MANDFLAFGWDAAGMLGKKQALAGYLGDQGDSGNWEVLDVKKFSFKRSNLSFPHEIESLFELLDGYKRERYQDFKKILAIDSPFAFPNQFMQWLSSDEHESPFNFDGGRDEGSSLQSFYEGLGFRAVDQYIEKKFEDEIKNFRPFRPFTV